MKGILRTILLMACLLLGFAFSVWTVSAQTPEADAGNPIVSTVQSGGQDVSRTMAGMSVTEMLLRVIVSLIFIIVIFVVLIKVLTQKRNKWFAGRTVRSLGGVSLGPNKSLQVIEAGGAVYIVGVGDNISLIDKVDDPEAMEVLLSSLSPEPQPLSGWLGRISKGRQQQEVEAEPMSASFQEMLHRKIHSMPSRKKWVESMLHDEQTIGRSEKDE
jgi:flagellar protein FliO/FliZ